VVKAVGSDLKRFAYSTIAGREIGTNDNEQKPAHFMLMPHSRGGDLLPETELGELRAYLRQSDRREMLLKRSCAVRKPWYAFHETPPLPDILRSKILCKAITRSSFFVVDETGALVPRHSVYYIVPKDPSRITVVFDIGQNLYAEQIIPKLRNFHDQGGRIAELKSGLRQITEAFSPQVTAYILATASPEFQLSLSQLISEIIRSVGTDFVNQRDSEALMRDLTIDAVARRAWRGPAHGYLAKLVGPRS
jgi:hypothetical protein